MNNTSTEQKDTMKDVMDNLGELGITAEIISINALLDKQGYHGKTIIDTQTMCNMYAFKTKEDALKMKGFENLEPNYFDSDGMPAHVYYDHEIEKADVSVKYDRELGWNVNISKKASVPEELSDAIFTAIESAKKKIVMVTSLDNVIN